MKGQQKGNAETCRDTQGRYRNEWHVCRRQLNLVGAILFPNPGPRAPRHLSAEPYALGHYF